jgi:anti-sigma regulatory factor (Ser/Thr protein kinase)
MSCGELKLERSAVPSASRPMRHALAAFLTALDVSDAEQTEVITAVGEALANAVEHAYRGASVGDVSLRARLDGDGSLAVDVIDRGHYGPSVRQIDRGFGLRIMHAVAQSITVDASDGTSLRLFFKLAT